ncbi:boophilin-H2 [Ixodes scapularis]
MKAVILLCLVGVVVAQRNAICRLPKVVGPCKAALPRFYFNVDTGRCEDFRYGGCKGNENNFQLIEDCKKACEAPESTGNDYEHADFETSCKVPAEVGPCAAGMRRWFFNANTGACETFLYSGCGGNDNNYESQEECEFVCQPQ